MGSQDEVVMCFVRGIAPGQNQGIIVCRWFLRQDVEHRTGQLAGGKRCGYSCRLNHGPP